MAKIEIMGSPEELERISTFLKKNKVKLSIVKDFGIIPKKILERIIHC